ncbi:hypothetical protein C8E97_3327 [Saccharothrix australiensis]|uniref:Uncharacterized protein n=1 Tax=Saccharothrix australiensis TaxID=2072 RepID=A0A495W0P1_9PSEU|nr:hypothetical protein C8E97_3327 [Saccharothrix australiensis]
MDPDRYGPRLLRDAGTASATALRDWARTATGQGLGDTVEEVMATVHPAEDTAHQNST